MSRRDGLDAICLTPGHRTDIGLRRQVNEDSLLARSPLFAVADGMGGHEAGDVASRLCIEELAANSSLSSKGEKISAGDLQTALELADARIRQETGGRAGTTVSGVVLVEESGQPYWLFFNVGDSRSYRLNANGLEQVSVDHSEVQELMDLGQITAEEALVHPRRHVVTRALGAGTQNMADFWLTPVQVTDRILICSDGLTGELRDEQIQAILQANPDPQQASEELVQAALRSGGRDNITVIVLDAARPSAANRVPDAEQPDQDGLGDTATVSGEHTRTRS
ncbi:PP2C family protein-serine/threonine phosphatase [Arthrobacter sp. H14-L1]|uniref:PP2C family protein-serine/threonine phosphatase n=1 Tax=Arthrobacter sp. H14-L1 TaxID=2996697 RepID=UPI00227004BB|nr:protein phosphatase 2C domain-containing protein [Arthrobacter sp. H14-L1]MCY0904582.1 protein phosphatase 2C domain-containing protein [Arthrobacter sp. H14-L1]